MMYDQDVVEREIERHVADETNRLREERDEACHQRDTLTGELRAVRRYASNRLHHAATRVEAPSSRWEEGRAAAYGDVIERLDAALAMLDEEVDNQERSA